MASLLHGSIAYVLTGFNFGGSMTFRDLLFIVMIVLLGQFVAFYLYYLAEGNFDHSFGLSFMSGSGLLTSIVTLIFAKGK